MSGRFVISLFCTGLLLSPAAKANVAPKWCGMPLQAYGDGERNESPIFIVGNLTKRLIWGAPGFGENPKTDSRFRAWFLRLDYQTPVTLVPESDQAHVHAETINKKEIQIRGAMESDPSYQKFRGRHVAIQGLLWRASDPLDVADAELTPQKIDLIGPISCDGTLVKSPKSANSQNIGSK